MERSLFCESDYTTNSLTNHVLNLFESYVIEILTYAAEFEHCCRILPQKLYYSMVSSMTYIAIPASRR